MAEIKKKFKKMSKIVTHSGTFHADESLAVFMLKLLPMYKDAEIIRSRDPAVIADASVVVDVGGEYSPETFRFDHHQRGFSETFSPDHVIKLSSAGLVYKHFGKQVISQVLGFPNDHPQLNLIYKKTYNDFIEAFDGVDNGVSQYPVDVKPAYKNNTTIGDRVSQLNPNWNESNVDLFQQFLKAVQLTGDEFVSKVKYIANCWLPARDIVVQCIKDRKSVHPSGKIMVMSQFCPWKEHLHELETDMKISKDEAPLYVLYEDDREHSWRIQAVSIDIGSFVSRKPLPESWRGLRDEALAKLTGVPDSVFIHATGFIGGCKTKNGVISLAEQALLS